MSKNIIVGSRYTQVVGVHSHDPRTYEGEQTAFGGGREKMDTRSRHHGVCGAATWRHDTQAATHDDWNTMSE